MPDWYYWYYTAQESPLQIDFVETFNKKIKLHGFHLGVSSGVGSMTLSYFNMLERIALLDEEIAGRPLIDPLTSQYNFNRKSIYSNFVGPTTGTFPFPMFDEPIEDIAYITADLSNSARLNLYLEFDELTKADKELDKIESITKYLQNEDLFSRIVETDDN